MVIVEDILKHRAVLKAAADDSAMIASLDALCALKIPINTLQQTKVGKYVRRATSHTNPEVAGRAKTLVESWTRLITAPKRPRMEVELAGHDARVRRFYRQHIETELRRGLEEVQSAEVMKAANAGGVSTAAATATNAAAIATRAATPIIEKNKKGKADTDTDMAATNRGRVATVSRSIDHNIWVLAKCAKPSPAYKRRMREVIGALQANARLRAAVMSGSITPEQLAGTSARALGAWMPAQARTEKAD